MKLNTITNNDFLVGSKEIPNNSVDMVLMDLPYGTTKCSWDIIIPFDNLWKTLNRIIKDNGAIVLFGSQPFTTLLIASNLKNFRYEWIWEKQKASNFMTAKFQPLKYHENILVFSKDTHKYYPQKYQVLELQKIKNMNEQELKKLFESRDYDRFGKVDRRKTINNPKTNKALIGSEIKQIRNRDDGTRFPKSVLKINKSINKNVHPTQKPVALCEYLIKTYTNENEIVFDGCIGSGTTAIACINTNRKYIGFEKDSEIYNKCIERVTERFKDLEDERK